jgi:cell division protein FtsB
MMKKIVRLFTTFAPLIIGGIFLFNVAKTSLDINQKSKRVSSLEKEVANLQQEKVVLEKDLSKADDPAVIEREARDRLQMIRPGEKIVILPGSANVEDSSNSEDVLGQKVSKGPYFKEWWGLIFE